MLPWKERISTRMKRKNEEKKTWERRRRKVFLSSSLACAGVFSEFSSRDWRTFSLSLLFLFLTDFSWYEIYLTSLQSQRLSIEKLSMLNFLIPRAICLPWSINRFLVDQSLSLSFIILNLSLKRRRKLFFPFALLYFCLLIFFHRLIASEASELKN